MFDPDGSTKIVLKSSIVWALSESIEKLSSDRLKRVRGIPIQKTQKIKRRKENIETFEPSVEQIVFKSDEINVGDWCIFRFDSIFAPNIILPDECVVENMLIGSVVAFKFSMGKTEKDQQYHHDSVQIGTQGIEVLSTWYTVDLNGILISLGTNSNFFVDLKNYVATTTVPFFNGSNQSLSLTEDVFQLRQCILNFMN